MDDFRKPGVPPLPNAGGKKSHLEELEKAIYRRDRSAPLLRREQLQEHPHAAPAAGWKHEDNLSDDEVHAVRSSFFTKLFIVSLAFFAMAAGFGAYVILGGSDSVSSKNLDISVIGPVSVPAGTPLSLQVAIQNKNSTAIENAQLVVEYPDGTKAVGNPEKDLTYEKDPLGTLASGGLANHSIGALLYGATESSQHLKLTVEYNLKGSNTLFYADSGYDVTISSSPISVSVSTLSQVTSGQQVDLAVNVVSNSSAPIKGVLLQATYPFGFTPGNSSPSAAFGNATWNIGDMTPGAKRTIHVIGTLSAQDGEARVFKFSAGTASAGNAQAIGTAFVTASQPITVQKPFLGVAVTLDGLDSKTYATAPKSAVHASIAWANNTSSEIDNAVITVRLNGDLYDKQSISAGDGYYRSADNTITWDATTDPELGKLAAGASGTVNFDFKTLPTTAQSGSVSNPQVSFDVSVAGKRLGSSSAQETVASVDSRTIKISSDLALVSRMVYSTGPFRNAGPIPPKADNPVSYTVIWSITNTSNDANNAKVTATLPSYVSWVGTSVPAGQKIAFDPVSRKIQWDPGTIPADSGVTKPAREIAFQVSFLPSVSQVGTGPVILSNIELIGTDSWSGAALKDNRGDLNTRLSTDPNFQPGQDEVVR